MRQPSVFFTEGDVTDGSRDDLDNDEDDFSDADKLPDDAPSFLERIPLALEVLTVATLAGSVRDAIRLKEKPAVLEEDAAQGTAEKLAELIKAFTTDLEGLSAKWMKALGPISQNEQEAKAQMNLIMIAGLSALGTRYHLVQYILRQTVAKQRLVAIDKRCARTARDFLKGPANGQPGIRRVK